MHIIIHIETCELLEAVLPDDKTVQHCFGFGDREGDSCLVGCSVGYHQDYYETRTCKSDGSWSITSQELVCRS